MDVTRRIARNTAVLTVAEVVTAVINLFFTTYVARYLGTTGFGVLSTALAFTALFGVLTDIGLNQLTTREIARDRALASKYLGNVAVLKIFLAIITFAFIALTVNAVHYPAETKTIIYIVSLFLVFNAFCMTFYSMFQAHEQMEFITYGRVFNSALMLAGAVIAVGGKFGVTAFAFLYFIASAATLLFNLAVSIRKFAKPKIEIDFTFWKETLKEAWPFGLSGVFTGVYFWIGSVMLSFMKGDQAVGLFNAAYRLVFSLSVVPGVYFTAAFPVMAKFFVTSKDSLKIMNERSIKYMIMLAIPIAVGTSLLSDRIILLIFGPDYQGSIVALQLLVWAVAFVFISYGFARLFESLNKQLIVTIVAAACAAINIGLNLALVPLLSYKGAAIATVATEFAALAILSLLGSRFGFGISLVKILDFCFRTAAAGASMGILVYFLRNLNLVIVIPAGALLYFIVLFIIKGIDSDDRAMISRALRRGAPPVSKEIKNG